MFLTLLSILGVAGFVHILKFAQWRRQDVMAVGAVNYVVAMAAALVLHLHRAGGWNAPSASALWLGLAVGAGYVFTYVVMHLGVAGSGAALTGTVTNLSVVIAVLAAHFYWRDPAGPVQLAGVALTFVALPLLGTRARSNPQSSRRPALWILAVLFLAGGAWQTAMKVVSRLDDGAQVHAFIVVLFAAAAVTLSVPVLLRRGLPRAGEWATGAALGAANLLANLPFVLALRVGSGTLIFATRACGSVLVTVLLARLIWGERLRPVSWAGVLVAALSLVLVNLPSP